MARFLYKAKNNKGEVVTGTVKASNEAEAEKVLLKHNLVPTDIIAERQKPVWSFLTQRISVREKAVLSRQLATMLSAGLDLTKAITILAKQAKSEHLKKIFLDIFQDLQSGYNFSAALAKHPEAFDRVYVSVVNSGESTGKLDVVLTELAVQLEEDSSFISKVKSSLYYPGFILVVLFGAGIFMLSFVIPKLRVMFDEAKQELPLVTKVLLSLSGFFQVFWWLILLLIIGLIIFYKFWSMTEAGSRVIHNAQIQIPGLKNIYEGIYMYRFTRILSMLVGSGVPLLDALRIAATVMDNVIYEESIANVAAQVERGVPLSNPILKDPIFPPLVGNMIAVGEETGELDKVLSKVSDYYKEATNDLTKAISSLVEPVVLIIVGLGVAFIVFAIYIPVYQINQNIS